MPVEVILRNDAFARVYREALKHPLHFPDLPLGVVSPEFLTLMKMVARRTKDDSDLETLLGLGIVDLWVAQWSVRFSAVSVPPLAHGTRWWSWMR